MIGGWECQACTLMNSFACKSCNESFFPDHTPEETQSLTSLRDSLKRELESLRHNITKLKFTQRIVDQVLSSATSSPASSSAASSSSSSSSASSSASPATPPTTNEEGKLWDLLLLCATPDGPSEVEEAEASSASAARLGSESECCLRPPTTKRKTLSSSTEFREAIATLESELAHLQLDHECGICFEEVVSVTFSPCGHRFVCKTCAKALNASGNSVRCPICRVEVETFLSAYRPANLLESSSNAPELTTTNVSQWQCQGCWHHNNFECEVCSIQNNLVDPFLGRSIADNIKDTRQYIFLARSNLDQLRKTVSDRLISSFPLPAEVIGADGATDRLALYEAQLNKLLEKVTALIVDDECMICQNNQPATVTFFPCGHHVACKQCSRKCKICPGCGAPIKRMVVAYKA